MKNWAGNLEFHPTQVLAPASTAEAQELVKLHLQKNKSMRMRGSAHSWTGLISSQESFFHLDEMQGISNVNLEKKQVTALAGTKLKRFGEEAYRHRLALPNQGDVDHQSVAGALSTGTHGTGVTLQSMANQLRGMTLVTGTGEVVTVDENSEKLKALAVSFGSAGLITEATIQMIDAYKLKVESFAEDMNSGLAKYSERLKTNRHLEMFYFPVGDWAMVKMMNMTDEETSQTSKLDKVSELVLENWLYEGLNILAAKTRNYKTIDKIMRRFVSPRKFVRWSHQAYPTERTVRFMEMEYNLPLEKFEPVLEEIKSEIKRHNFETLFPIEIRFVKGDDLWLSPAYGRDSVYFAIHTYISEDFRPYFQKMEEIFKRHGGRPHWGKWHSLKFRDLQKLYPKWDDFLKIRQELDPQGLWLNDHLRDVLVPRPSSA